jgi:hypothetical protein
MFPIITTPRITTNHYIDAVGEVIPAFPEELQ